MFSGAGGKFDFLDKQLLSGNEEDEENTEPQMTQLDYEDADAAAMRAEFLRDAGKIARKPKSADPGILLGEVKELEDVGWASGRRTRKHPRGDD
jgi:DNA replication regulator DPB11